MQLSYERYLDQVLGGWIGKSMGGAIGARFEGYKGWIELEASKMFPDKMPPNDDLDLQVLWLKVLEEKGAALTSDDLADAWLEGCWYPFNEYGIFRRNWRLGIHPPMSGKFTNQFWETGEGCPIRAEIWGYAFPGAPDLAAAYSEMDGVLDHTEQSVGAEKMLAAMSSMAFFVPDVRRLAAMFSHYLPVGTPIERLTRAAFQAYDEGLSLRDARDRLMALEGNPEACDSQINIPFTFLGLLYGGNDLEKVMLSALACGYDTDCTLASAAALVGQILGAKRIPAYLKQPIGDELVMGIQYNRPEMTLTALARDTARVGVLLSEQMCTGIEITGAPQFAPFPPAAVIPPTRLFVEYQGLPAAAPGDEVKVLVKVSGKAPAASTLHISGPQGWSILPATAVLDETHRIIPVTLTAPVGGEAWPMKNLFQVTMDAHPELSHTFGVAGAGLWKLLGIYYDELPEAGNKIQEMRRFNQHYVSLKREYLPEPGADVAGLFAAWSRKLGQPAVVASYEHEVDVTRLIGLQGPFCAYLSRTILSPDARTAYIVIGNNDGYRLYLNDELVAEMDESTYWAPFNNAVEVNLKPGENHLLLKLLRRGSEVHFTLGLRETTGGRGHMNTEDWMVDLADLI
jgi:hypothetical protein